MSCEREQTQLLRQTADAIAAQPVVPRSPGVVREGKPQLCTGAAIVYEAAKRVSPPRDLDRLAADMIAFGKDEILRRAGELNLDRCFVESAVLRNDSYGDRERRERMLEWLAAASAPERGAAQT
jgi:hypothetical protein